MEHGMTLQQIGESVARIEEQMKTLFRMREEDTKAADDRGLDHEKRLRRLEKGLYALVGIGGAVAVIWAIVEKIVTRIH
jgi:hypothetical protein